MTDEIYNKLKSLTSKDLAELTPAERDAIHAAICELAAEIVFKTPEE